MSIELIISLKILLSNCYGEYLVLQHPSSSKRNPNKWDLPGGKMNPDKPYLLELCREVEEETGLNIEIDHIIGIIETMLMEQKILTLIFQGRANSTIVRLSREHYAYKWINPDQVKGLEFNNTLQDFFKNIQL